MLQERAVCLGGQKIRAVALAPGCSHPFARGCEEAVVSGGQSAEGFAIDDKQMREARTATAAKTDESDLVISEEKDATA